MGGWSNKTEQLIAAIENEHKEKPLNKCLMERKQDIKEISEQIIQLKGYDINIKKDGNKYFKDMLELYNNIPGKQDNYFYVFVYTDLLKKLEESPSNFHAYMTICVIMPQLYKAIKYYCGELDGGINSENRSIR